MIITEGANFGYKNPLPSSDPWYEPYQVNGTQGSLFWNDWAYVTGTSGSARVNSSELVTYDFESFYNDLKNEYNGLDFSLSLELHYGNLWFVGNSTIYGTQSSFGGLNDLNFLHYDVATVFGKIPNDGSTWDQVTNQRINQLHPNVQGPARQFVNLVKSQLGIKLRVTSGYRSFAEQNALYAKGRTTPGSIVTNAKGGYSYHNYGLAIDLVEIANGQAIWNTNWSSISEIGINIGFEWGGNFTGLTDTPHFQMTFGYSISQLLNLHNSGKW